MQEGQLLWSPSDDFSKGSNLSQYMRWLQKTRALVFEDYETLRRWSVTNIEDFWGVGARLNLTTCAR